MFLKPFLFFLVLCLASIPVVSASGKIYYYQDEKGTFHFTDLPKSDSYRPFILSPSNDLYGQDFTELIQNYAQLYSVDPKLIRAMIEVESGLNPGAISAAGAQGLMQIMPQTQKYLGLNCPFEPESNIEAGTRYFRYLLDRFETLPLALAAYNAGPSRVETYNGIPPFKETQEYVRKVLELYTRLQKSG